MRGIDDGREFGERLAAEEVHDRGGLGADGGFVVVEGYGLLGADLDQLATADPETLVDVVVRVDEADREFVGAVADIGDIAYRLGIGAG